MLGQGRSHTRGGRVLVVVASLVPPFALYASTKVNVRYAVPFLSPISRNVLSLSTIALWFHVNSRSVASLTNHRTFVLHE